MLKKTAVTTVTAMMCLGLWACGDNDSNPPPVAATPDPVPAPIAAPQTVGPMIALTTSSTLTHSLISFDPATPGTLIGSVAISNLPAGESLLGIDQRPADGKLYALGSSGAIYIVDPATGVGTRKAGLIASAGDDLPFTALAGTRFGVDFNPVADRLRVVSDTGQNLRINVDTGAAITDGVINGGAPTAKITASAYTNSFNGTTTTQLFNLDSAGALRYLQDPPNVGTLAGPAPLGIAATEINGFDIDSRNNQGWAAFGAAGSTMLYRIDLAAATNAATAIGAIGSADAIVGLVVNRPVRAVAYGLSAASTLVSFDPATPNTLIATRQISGMGSSETLIGFDFRPADGRLYGLSDAANIYIVDPATGAATLKSALAPDPADATAPYTALAGSIFSVDFNPVADRLRVVSDTGQSLRINVDSGITITDGGINRATAASVVGAAYASNFAGATVTTLYDLDATTDVLAMQTPPNDGTLVDVGPLGIDLTGAVAFDIAGGANGLALAAIPLTSSGPSVLYGIALATGQASLYRNATADIAPSRIGGATGPRLIDLALSLVPIGG